MTRVYLADAQPEERSALRLLLLDLNMPVVGEAADWPTTLAQAPATHPDMLLVDWNSLPNGSGVALAELRMACQAAMVVVLISHLDARQQAALSAGADAFISKGETPDRVAERLLTAAGAFVLDDTIGRVSRLLPEEQFENRRAPLPGAPAKTGAAYPKDQEAHTMNKDVFEGKWKEMRGQFKEWWGKLTDDGLERVAGKYDQLIGVIQEKYGYTRERVEKEFNGRMAKFEANQKKSGVPTP